MVDLLSFMSLSNLYPDLLSSIFNFLDLESTVSFSSCSKKTRQIVDSKLFNFVQIVKKSRQGPVNLGNYWISKFLGLEIDIVPKNMIKCEKLLNFCCDDIKIFWNMVKILNSGNRKQIELFLKFNQFNQILVSKSFVRDCDNPLLNKFLQTIIEANGHIYFRRLVIGVNLLIMLLISDEAIQIIMDLCDQDLIFFDCSNAELSCVIFQKTGYLDHYYYGHFLVHNDLNQHRVSDYKFESSDAMRLKFVEWAVCRDVNN